MKKKTLKEVIDRLELNDLMWKVEGQPYFAVIDGVKEGPYSAKELSDIFKKRKFKKTLEPFS